MRLGKVLVSCGVISALAIGVSSFSSRQAEAQSSRPYVVFVNSWQNCCAWGMNDLQNRLINELNAEPRYVSYSNFDNNGSSSNTSTDERFLRDGENLINQLDRSRPLILIGHSFGGDSILKLLPRIKRRIQFVAVIDPVSTGGVRATLSRFTVPDNVDYFYNRWQDNEPFPIDYKVNGSIRCNARRCDQDKQPFVTHANGQVHRENCKLWETCKKKNRRASHQELAKDPWIQRVIGDRVGEQLAAFRPQRNTTNPIGVSMQLAQTFGYIKNSRLVATGISPEPMDGHMNWATKTGQSLDTVKNEIRSDLNQARSLIAQSPSMQSCEAFGYMKNGMLALLRGTTEPHKEHVGWCRIELERGNWGQVVSAMDQEFVQPIQATLR